MNRAERRAGQRDGTVCEHGHLKKTDGTGSPLCPHRCGFNPGLPPVGSKVRLARDGRRWWDVRCADDRFASPGTPSSARISTASSVTSTSSNPSTVWLHRSG
ncbi:hypothetical protein, partial [Mycolicibacterium canariasense]|uniref:hypothetical protein n=1 Tax=Mycolicibacterium canariasense TaxID=228230 RepID=UPI001A7E6400